jgi:rhamnosyltransferase
MIHRIAVLMASYNGEKYIREQLLSILNQQDVELHIFINDDGSTDNTRKVVMDVMSTTKLITLLPEGNYSGSASGNFLWMISNIDFSDFTYVSLADQDDIWALNKLSRASQILEQQGAQGYSSNLFSYSIEEGTFQYIKKNNAQKPYDYMFQGASAGCTYLVSTQIINKIKQKIKNIPSSDFINRSHDWLIYAIARSFGYKWVCDQQAHIFYRQHSANVYGDRMSIVGILKKLNEIRSGWYRFNIIWLSQFIQMNEMEKMIISRIERWSWSDRLFIATHANLFRRSHLHVILLVFFALLGFM